MKEENNYEHPEDRRTGLQYFREILTVTLPAAALAATIATHIYNIIDSQSKQLSNNHIIITGLEKSVEELKIKVAKLDDKLQRSNETMYQCRAKVEHLIEQEKKR